VPVRLSPRRQSKRLSQSELFLRFILHAGKFQRLTPAFQRIGEVRAFGTGERTSICHSSVTFVLG